MLVFSGFGVTSTFGNLPYITSAVTDAQEIYSVLEYAGGSFFDHQKSIVFGDCRAQEAEVALQSTVRMLSPSDIHVVFFSGHGVLRDDGSLGLCFRDTVDSSSSDGQLTSRRIREILLSGKNNSCLLIIDACHAGTALKEADLYTLSDPGGLSVLASNPSFSRAKYDETGSHFTAKLKAVIGVLAGAGGALSLTRIAAKLNNEFHGEIEKPVINISSGEADIELVPQFDWSTVGEPAGFSERLLLRILRADLNLREFMWLDVARAPDEIKTRILNALVSRDSQIISSDLKNEPSWRVRRAIGQVVRGLNPGVDQRIDLTEQFLNSANWMNRCVGLAAFGGLEEVNRPNEMVLDILKENESRSDETWLANLYLAEGETDFFSDAIRSNLAKSSWGVVDIWRRHCGQEESTDIERLEEAVETLADETILSTLALHNLVNLHFSASPYGKAIAKRFKSLLVGNDEAYLESLTRSSLVRELYTSKTRQDIPENVPLRWAVYDLHGRWRDAINVHIADFLENSTDGKIIDELNACSKVPLVELKMGLCVALTNADLGGRNQLIQDCMRWTLQEGHPWLRREALPLFSINTKEFQGALEHTDNPLIYPGIFDLFLQAAQLGHLVDVDLVEKTAKTPAEGKSVRDAIAVELAHRS